MKPQRTQPQQGPISKALLAQWKAGAQLAVLATAAGIKRSKFRRLLQAAVGGQASYRALRASGAGGAHDPTSNLRRARRADGSATPRVSDVGVKRLHHARASKGWTTARVFGPAAVRITDSGGSRTIAWRSLEALIFISPKGNRYVRASAHEQADLIITHDIVGIPPTRLRRYETSGVKHRATQRAKELKRGEAGLTRKRATRRERKAARRARQTEAT